MRTLLTIILSLSLTLVVGQYPIKTIFKGDSVVILTIAQSNSINASIERSSRAVKDLKSRIAAQDDTIASLKREVMKRDSLSSMDMNIIDTLSEKLNQCEEVYDSIWVWALGPSLIYTQYPDDDVVYILDLSRYYMTTDDFGIIMPRMSDREYEKYKDFVQRYGMDQKAIWEFKNDIDIKALPKEEITNRKVWKYKKQWK